MENWQRVFRASLPHLPRKGLVALREAWAEDSEELFQGATVEPAALYLGLDWPITCACSWIYAAWKGGQVQTPEEAETWFGWLCEVLDMALGEAAACRHFLIFHDETPRQTVRALLVPEIDPYLKENPQ